MNFLQNEHLLFNSKLVQRRKDKNRTKFVTKKDIKEDVGNEIIADKNWIASFTEKHPEVFKEFKEKTASKIKPVKNEDIVSENLSEICEYLISKLKEIPSGKKHANEYHDLIMGILELIFYPSLCSPTKEVNIHDGRKRIDITFDNCAETGFFFRLGNTHGIPSQFVVIECKNYSEDVKNEELDQLSGRFSPVRGKFGILTCRSLDNEKLCFKRCNDAYTDNRGLIIPIVDNDLIEILLKIIENDEDSWDKIIQEKFHMVVLQ